MVRRACRSTTRGPNGSYRYWQASFRILRLRPIDLLGLTFDSLVDAIPDQLASARAVTREMASAAVTASQTDTAETAALTVGSNPPVVVVLADESIERLAQRIAELLRPALRAVKRAKTTGKAGKGRKPR